MDQAKAGFVATVYHRDALRRSRESGNAREEFWRPIQQRRSSADSDAPQSIDELERNVVAGLPTVLQSQLAAHFRRPWSSRDRFAPYPRDLDSIFFRASIEGYGSALLAIDVSGVRDLADLLRGNLDTFTLLMESFLPEAFADLLPTSHVGAEFLATIAPTAELSRVFAEARSAYERSARSGEPTPTPGVGVGVATWAGKGPRALAVTAVSLLTPVVLALIILYCAAQMLLQERAELSKREALVASEEQELRKTQSTAVVELQKENVELLRLLRTPAPGPTSTAKP